MKAEDIAAIEAGIEAVARADSPEHHRTAIDRYHAVLSAEARLKETLYKRVESILADARLAAQLRKFVEEHGDELWSWVAPDGQDDAAMRMALALEKLLAAAR